MRTKISELAESKSILENSYISQAEATWQDEVKRKFFDSHIPPIRSEYNAFSSIMESTADVFTEAEKVINSLLEQL
ncbi:MAG: hypothetical protein FWD60_04410 [Candidatus Azobacteroides sp.]|nr:hypothetical protein [Candidatus Azobacteroides sp.]